MNELEVQLVRLEPMRVASFHAFGQSPEHAAWAKVIAWAEPRGLVGEPLDGRIFGFDNPAPSPGSPNYGYEFWIAVGPDVQPDGQVTIKRFPGGLYAVTRCKGLHTLGDTWHQLCTWRHNGKYKCAGHQWLEGHVGPVLKETKDEELVLDLYMPIAE